MINSFMISYCRITISIIITYLWKIYLPLFPSCMYSKQIPWMSDIVFWLFRMYCLILNSLHLISISENVIYNRCTVYERHEEFCVYPFLLYLHLLMSCSRGKQWPKQHDLKQTNKQKSKKPLLTILISLQMNKSIWIICGLLFVVFWSCIYEYILHSATIFTVSEKKSTTLEALHHLQ